MGGKVEKFHKVDNCVNLFKGKMGGKLTLAGSTIEAEAV